MIIDKSAIISILNLDIDATKLAKAIEDSQNNYITVVDYFGISAFIENKYGDKGIRELNQFYKKAGIVIHEVNEEITDLAIDAYRFYAHGKGEGKLNFGECFTYALSKFLNEPLLFKGDHFKNTDIIPAI